MPIVVDVKPQAEFEQWLADTRAATVAQAASATEEWSLAQLMERGEQVYNTGCAACHQAAGQGIPGAFPALAGSPVALGDIDVHIDIVLHGKSGTAMQAFGSQLNAVDLAAVITYERNAWGNDAGDSVSPQRITELQQQ
jgi:cytochrome c oxidase subunit 2